LHPGVVDRSRCITFATPHPGAADRSPALKYGYGTDMERLIVEVLEKTPRVIETVAAQLPPGFPQKLLDVITTGLQTSAKRLAAMPSR
jgi:hypothetical protein